MSHGRLTGKAWIRILASVQSQILRLFTGGTVLNERRQTSNVGVLIGDVVLQLLDQCNQIVNSTQQVLYLGMRNVNV